MPRAPAAPVAEEPKEICWFEVQLRPWVEVVQSGRPDRIWRSDDPRWAEIEKTKQAKAGTLIYGTCVRVGEEIVPNSVKVRASLQMQWHSAQEMMKKWETEGRLWDTPEADALRERESQRDQGMSDAATMIANALRPAASLVPANDARLTK